MTEHTTSALDEALLELETLHKQHQSRRSKDQAQRMKLIRKVRDLDGTQEQVGAAIGSTRHYVSKLWKQQTGTTWGDA